ncbi:uncharacterized protein LOC108252719 [Diaphorina citri]|uniref:Uncharacterized protein LOC108252719 n=1 Tax=Diaphorina citri TaxID=121845 RepID=A0A1S4EEZ0_DIACI|nr:uncharacterized protein LOC108252719 [Diaphorina citri]
MSYNQKVKKHIGLKTKYLNSIKATFDLIDCEDKRSTFLVRCEKLDIVYQSFETAINKLIELNAEVPEGEDETDIEKDSSDCDAMFYAIKAALRELTPAPPNPSPSLDPAHVTREDELKKPRIPKINIEPFAGAIEQFSSFKSLYDTLIHNSNLSNIEKFSYLLSLLKGKALLTVKAFEFNDANYLRAYNKLSEEFSNPRLVATHYLNKILSIKPASSESVASLRYFLDTFNMDVEALQDINLPNLAEFIFLHIALKNIPIDTRRLFEQDNLSAEIPTLKSLMTFMRNRVTILEISPETRKPVSLNQSRSFLTTRDEKEPSPTKGNSMSCPVCNDSHRINQCPKFLSMSVADRHNSVKIARLCFCCLGPHPKFQCKSMYSCRTCHDRSHHTLLHQLSSAPKMPAKNGNFPQHKEHKAMSSSQALTSQVSCTSTNVLLGTAIAQVQCSSGLWHSIRLVIDTGSMLNFVSSSLAQLLNLPKNVSPGNVTGLGHTPVSTLQSSINLRLSPIGDTYTPCLNLNANIIPSISSEIPSAVVPASVAQRFKNVYLADYSIFEKPSKVDLLLGAAHLGEILLSNQPIIPGSPSCWPTIFGHVLLGAVPACNEKAPRQSLFVTSNDQLSHQLKVFWETEEVIHPKISNPDDEACESHFLSTKLIMYLLLDIYSQ